MQLKKFFRSYKTILIMTGVIVVSLVGFLMGVVPLGQTVFKMADAVVTLSSDVSVLQGKSTVLQSMDEETLRKNLLELSAAVPPDKSISSVMTTLDGISAQTGVAIGDVTIQKPGSIATDSAKKLNAQEAKIGSSILPISLSVHGTDNQIQSFLGMLTGVLKKEDATIHESFTEHLLEYPQFTQPRDYQGMTVPDVLLSGNHAAISAWQQKEAEKRTKKRAKG